MKLSSKTCFRCIFQGITIPKEVSPYHLRSLQLAMEIREGIIPELTLHQRRVQKIKEIGRCSVTKYVRPLQPGFQCLHHCFLEDTELTQIDGKGVPVSEISSLAQNLEDLSPSSQLTSRHTMVHFNMQNTTAASVRKFLARKISDAMALNGVEDSFAISVQRTSLPLELFRGLREVEGKNPSLRTSRLTVGTKPHEKLASTGYLYSMKLRRIPVKQRSLIGPAIDSLETNGFLNYFTSEVFGKRIKNGFLFGSHLMNKEYRAIVNLLLRGGKSESAEFDSDCIDKNEIKKLSHRSASENAVSAKEIVAVNASVQGLLHTPHDVTSTTLDDVSEAAVEKILKKSLLQRTIANWLAELCCMIWNKVVSRRVAVFGAFRVLPGDIVHRDGDYAFITAADIEAKRVSCLDVLMPVPGTDVSLPHNECALMYESIFESFRLPKDMEKWTIAMHQNAVRGSYRAMVMRPIQLSHTITTEQNDLTLELSFRLPHRSFGSMLVRELCKLEMNTPQECGVNLDKLDRVENDPVKPVKESVEKDILGIKPRNLTEQQKLLYAKRYAPERKKYTSARVLHKTRLVSVIYRRIYQQGSERWRKLKVNGRLT